MNPSRRTPAPRSATQARGDGDFAPSELQAPMLGSIWAKITGQASGTTRYSWEQIDEGDIAAFDTGLAAGFAAAGGTGASEAPGYEINGRTDVPTGTRVRMWPAGDLSYYLFTYPGLGTGPAPGAPTDTTATPGEDGTVLVQYTAPAGIPVPTQYVVEYSTDGVNFTQYTVTPDTEVTFAQGVLEDGVPYYFAVYAVSAGGAAGPYSNVVSATPDATTPTVSSATVAAGGETLTIVFTEAVDPVAGWSTFVTLSGDTSATATYVSGDGTDTIVFSLDATVYDGDTVTLNIAAGTLEDAVGNDNAAVSGGSVTNNSTQTVSGCCTTELALHPSIYLHIPDGFDVGDHELTWGAATAPDGGDSWTANINLGTNYVYCRSGIWYHRKLTTTTAATSQTCGPLALSFGAVSGASGNVTANLTP